MSGHRSPFSVLGAMFVFTFLLGAATVLIAATHPVELVGRVLVEPPGSRVQKDPAYVAVAQTAAAAGKNQTGQSMYAKAGCETCHGSNGQGTAAGPRIAGTARDVPGFIGYVRKPTGTMPPQGPQSVSDQALGDIHAFLRSVSAAVVGRALSAPPDSRVQKDPAYQAPSGRSDVGAALYAKVGCYQCHANQAQGGLSGPRIGPDPIPFARFSQYTRAPSGDMPPYTAKVLSNQDLADIYAFLQSLPRPPAVNTIPQLAP